MEYAVFRFTRNEIQEQWIIPTKKLLTFMGITQRKVTFPIELTEHGNVYNVLFCRLKPRLFTAHGFTRKDSYVFFEPSVSVQSSVLDLLIEQWCELAYVKKVAPTTMFQESLHRL
jgi:hypothetical protein